MTRIENRLNIGSNRLISDKKRTNRRNKGFLYSACQITPTVVGRIGLIIEVIHLKNDWFGDYYHLSGSVIFSMIFCILLYIISLMLASSVSD